MTDLYNVEHEKSQLAEQKPDHRGLCRPRWEVLILLITGETWDGLKEGNQII